MVAFLALLAEATNAISAAVIVSCLLLVTVLIMRYQHGDEGGSSVVRVQNRPVQVAMQKLFVPYTLTMVREEGAFDSGSDPPSCGMTRVRVRCGAVGRGVLVRWWWGVRRDALLTLLHAPWQRHHDTVRDSSALHGCGGSLELDEGSHTVVLELPQGRPLGLGHAPRDGYPLVVVQLDPAQQEEDHYRVGSVVSLLHVPDSACPEPARMLYQYLKQRTGQLTLVTTLFTQANGVNSSTAPNTSEHNISSASPSTEPPVTAHQHTPSTSAFNTDHGNKGSSSSLSESPNLASNELPDTNSPSDVVPTASCSSSSSKNLGTSESKIDDDITGWEWQTEEDDELERQLNNQDMKNPTHSVVSENRPVVEEVIPGNDDTYSIVDTNTGMEKRVAGSEATGVEECCSIGSDALRRRPATADDELLVDNDQVDHSSAVDRVTCIRYLRVTDCPDDQTLSQPAENSSKEVRRSLVDEKGIENIAPGRIKIEIGQQLPSAPNLFSGAEEASSSEECTAQTDAESTPVVENPSHEDDTTSVPAGEVDAGESEFSSSDCVVCQECRTSLALLPCRHVCVCFSCFDQLMTTSQQACPLCRQRVQAFFEV